MAKKSYKVGDLVRINDCPYNVPDNTWRDHIDGQHFVLLNKRESCFSLGHPSGKGPALDFAQEHDDEHLYWSVYWFKGPDPFFAAAHGAIKSNGKRLHNGSKRR